MKSLQYGRGHATGEAPSLALHQFVGFFTHEFEVPLSTHGVGRSRVIWYHVLFMPQELAKSLPLDKHPRLRVRGEITGLSRLAEQSSLPRQEFKQERAFGARFVFELPPGVGIPIDRPGAYPRKPLYQDMTATQLHWVVAIGLVLGFLSGCATPPGTM